METEEEIVDMFKDDYNIIAIHEKILDKINKDKQNLSKLIENKEKEEQYLLDNMATINRVEKFDRLEKIKELEKKIESIQNNNYIERLGDMLDRYKQYPIGSKERIDVILEYIELAKDYIKINVVRKLDDNNLCPHCGINLDEIYVDENTNCCPKCSGELKIFSKIPGYNRYKKMHINKNSYDDRNNFRRALYRYQGKQDAKIPQSVFEKLDRYFRSLNIPTGDEIKKLPCDELGHKPGTSLQLMLNALKNTKLNYYYEDANLICKLYWGWNLPDLSHLEDKIMEDYCAFQNVYKNIKRNRKSSLNTQLILYHLLRHNGHKCRPEDFKIINTDDIIKYHQNMISKIFNILGWK